MAGIGLADEPVELVVEGGHLTSARGGQGMAFMELLTAHGEDGTNVAELGIGTNEKAILTGNILEDEKILGTAHVAFGASAAIGGQRPGAGPPRLRGDEADGRARRRADRPRGRAAGLTMARDPLLVGVPNFSEGRSERVIDALEATLGGPLHGPERPLRPPAQPQRLHPGRGARTGWRRRCWPAPSTRWS